jgi:inner membrane protein
MASFISHAIVGLSIGTCFYDSRAPKWVWLAGAACAMAPDVDVIGFELGVPYGKFWGHRGFTHSLFFAALIATLVWVIASRLDANTVGRLRLWLYLFLATASHGVLDAMTNGGLGVAFFSPFNNQRYFLPWRPIRVSPIGFAHFFTTRGLAVLQSEALWIWLPAVALMIVAFTLRRAARIAES